ncbi:hypothetical protein [Spirosoma sp.]|uniref:hypothetical protein n=1 Tax=Spirosoma sp. TaxID=1899569 RepID=UPI0026092CD5|nr:hypothetical protein [Spirosoma sp.]MCX6218231.1 hypothetical protein [Spirosoma sp.]
MYLRIALLRALFWIFATAALITLPEQAVAQDSLTYSIDSSLTLAPPTVIDATISGKWRLSTFIGYHRLYEKGYLNELYLKHGLHASLTADYFIGPHLGIGVLVGYQSLQVDKSYNQSSVIPINSYARTLPLTALHTFMLTVGPALSVSLSKRLSLNANLRGGLFYHSVPVLSAYSLSYTNGDLLNGKLVATTILPTSQRVQPGANALLSLNYQVTSQFSLGLAASASYSSVRYARLNTANDFSQKQLDLPTYGAQITASFRLAPASPSSVVVASQPKVVESGQPVPVCYPPLLDPAQSNLFRVGGIERPVFRWRSSAPIYTEGEQYTVQIYTLPGNKLVYEKVLKEQQLAWPSQLPLPDTASFYFYTVYTSRISEYGHLCRSEPVAGTISFFKGQPTNKPLMTRPSFRTYAIKLYELASAKVAPPDLERVNFFMRTLQKVGLLINPQTTTTGQSATPADSTQLVMQTPPKLVYEGPVEESAFAWPARVPLPARPTAYEYIISALDNQEVAQRSYLIVEPNGCYTIIGDDTKNSFLRFRGAPAAVVVPPDPVPVNKK